MAVLDDKRKCPTASYGVIVCQTYHPARDAGGPWYECPYTGQKTAEQRILWFLEKVLATSRQIMHMSKYC